MKILVAIVLFFSLFKEIETDQPPQSFISLDDIQCLAANIYYEARGEPKVGQIAVAHVTINRVKDGRFASDICSVVKQPKQFSWYKDHIIEQLKIPTHIRQLAQDVLTNKYSDPTYGALFYHNDTVGPFKRVELIRIGRHIFYA